MFRSLFKLAPLALVAAVAALSVPEANAQNQTLLAEVYGQGVHAYYAGQLEESESFLTAAIDGGSRDPRAYYFRGIVHHSNGNADAAESDWEAGAKLEAGAGDAAAIGRALSRFQGSARLRLELIRSAARLAAMTSGQSRSTQRLGQLGVESSPAPAGANAAAANPPAASSPAAAAPPAAPPVAIPANPFSDDTPLAGGQPKVEADNALEGLDDNPFADDPAPAAGGDTAAAGGAAGGDPFSGGAAPAAPASGNDPFSGDPFNSGGGAAPAAGGTNEDPFAPSGGGGAADTSDPFSGGDPFGN